jgi:hypothetical protein
MSDPYKLPKSMTAIPFEIIRVTSGINRHTGILTTWYTLSKGVRYDAEKFTLTVEGEPEFKPGQIFHLALQS